MNLTMTSSIWWILAFCLVSSESSVENPVQDEAIGWSDWTPCQQGDEGQSLSYRFKTCDDHPHHHHRNHDHKGCSGTVLEVASRVCVPECETVIIQRLVEDDGSLQNYGGVDENVAECLQMALEQSKVQQESNNPSRPIEAVTQTNILHSDDIIGSQNLTMSDRNTTISYHEFITGMLSLLNPVYSKRTSSMEERRVMKQIRILLAPLKQNAPAQHGHLPNGNGNDARTSRYPTRNQQNINYPVSNLRNGHLINSFERTSGSRGMANNDYQRQDLSNQRISSHSSTRPQPVVTAAEGRLNDVPKGDKLEQQLGGLLRAMKKRPNRPALSQSKKPPPGDKWPPNLRGGPPPLQRRRGRRDVDSLEVEPVEVNGSIFQRVNGLLRQKEQQFKGFSRDMDTNFAGHLERIGQAIKSFLSNRWNNIVEIILPDRTTYTNTTDSITSSHAPHYSLLNMLSRLLDNRNGAADESSKSETSAKGNDSTTTSSLPGHKDNPLDARTPSKNGSQSDQKSPPFVSKPGDPVSIVIGNQKQLQSQNGSKEALEKDGSSLDPSELRYNSTIVSGEDQEAAHKRVKREDIGVMNIVNMLQDFKVGVFNELTAPVLDGIGRAIETMPSGTLTWSANMDEFIRKLNNIRDILDRGQPVESNGMSGKPDNDELADFDLLSLLSSHYPAGDLTEAVSHERIVDRLEELSHLSDAASRIHSITKMEYLLNDLRALSQMLQENDILGFLHQLDEFDNETPNSSHYSEVLRNLVFFYKAQRLNHFRRVSIGNLQHPSVLRTVIETLQRMLSQKPISSNDNEVIEFMKELFGVKLVDHSRMASRNRKVLKHIAFLITKINTSSDVHALYQKLLDLSRIPEKQDPRKRLVQFLQDLTGSYSTVDISGYRHILRNLVTPLRHQYKTQDLPTFVHRLFGSFPEMIKKTKKSKWVAYLKTVLRNYEGHNLDSGRYQAFLRDIATLKNNIHDHQNLKILMGQLRFLSPLLNQSNINSTRTPSSLEQFSEPEEEIISTMAILTETTTHQNGTAHSLKRRQISPQPSKKSDFAFLTSVLELGKGDGQRAYNVIPKHAVVTLFDMMQALRRRDEPLETLQSIKRLHRVASSMRSYQNMDFIGNLLLAIDELSPLEMKERLHRLNGSESIVEFLQNLKHTALFKDSLVGVKLLLSLEDASSENDTSLHRFDELLRSFSNLRSSEAETNGTQPYFNSRILDLLSNAASNRLSMDYKHALDVILNWVGKLRTVSSNGFHLERLIQELGTFDEKYRNDATKNPLLSFIDEILHVTSNTPASINNSGLLKLATLMKEYLSDHRRTGNSLYHLLRELQFVQTVAEKHSLLDFLTLLRDNGISTDDVNSPQTLASLMTRFISRGSLNDNINLANLLRYAFARNITFVDFLLLLPDSLSREDPGRILALANLTSHLEATNTSYLLHIMEQVDGLLTPLKDTDEQEISLHPLLQMFQSLRDHNILFNGSNELAMLTNIMKDTRYLHHRKELKGLDFLLQSLKGANLEDSYPFVKNMTFVDFLPLLPDSLARKDPGRILALANLTSHLDATNTTYLLRMLDQMDELLTPLKESDEQSDEQNLYDTLELLINSQLGLNDISRTAWNEYGSSIAQIIEEVASENSENIEDFDELLRILFHPTGLQDITKKSDELADVIGLLGTHADEQLANGIRKNLDILHQMSSQTQSNISNMEGLAQFLKELEGLQSGTLYQQAEGTHPHLTMGFMDSLMHIIQSNLTFDRGITNLQFLTKLLQESRGHHYERRLPTLSRFLKNLEHLSRTPSLEDTDQAPANISFVDFLQLLDDGGLSEGELSAMQDLGNLTNRLNNENISNDFLEFVKLSRMLQSSMKVTNEPELSSYSLLDIFSNLSGSYNTVNDMKQLRRMLPFREHLDAGENDAVVNEIRNMIDSITSSHSLNIIKLIQFLRDAIHGGYYTSSTDISMLQVLSTIASQWQSNLTASDVISYGDLLKVVGDIGRDQEYLSKDENESLIHFLTSALGKDDWNSERFARLYQFTDMLENVSTATNASEVQRLMMDIWAQPPQQEHQYHRYLELLSDVHSNQGGFINADLDKLNQIVTKHADIFRQFDHYNTQNFLDLIESYYKGDVVDEYLGKDENEATIHFLKSAMGLNQWNSIEFKRLSHFADLMGNMSAATNASEIQMLIESIWAQYPQREHQYQRYLEHLSDIQSKPGGFLTVDLDKLNQIVAKHADIFSQFDPDDMQNFLDLIGGYYNDDLHKKDEYLHDLGKDESEAIVHFLKSAMGVDYLDPKMLKQLSHFADVIGNTSALINASEIQRLMVDIWAQSPKQEHQDQKYLEFLSDVQSYIEIFSEEDLEELKHIVKTHEDIFGQPDPYNLDNLLDIMDDSKDGQLMSLMRLFISQQFPDSFQSDDIFKMQNLANITRKLLPHMTDDDVADVMRLFTDHEDHRGTIGEYLRLMDYLALKDAVSANSSLDMLKELKSFTRSLPSIEDGGLRSGDITYGIQHLLNIFDARNPEEGGDILQFINTLSSEPYRSTWPWSNSVLDKMELLPVDDIPSRDLEGDMLGSIAEIFGQPHTGSDTDTPHEKLMSLLDDMRDTTDYNPSSIDVIAELNRYVKIKHLMKESTTAIHSYLDSINDVLSSGAQSLESRNAASLLDFLDHSGLDMDATEYNTAILDLKNISRIIPYPIQNAGATTSIYEEVLRLFGPKTSHTSLLAFVDALQDVLNQPDIDVSNDPVTLNEISSSLGHISMPMATALDDIRAILTKTEEAKSYLEYMHEMLSSMAERERSMLPELESLQNLEKNGILTFLKSSSSPLVDKATLEYLDKLFGRKNSKEIFAAGLEATLQDDAMINDLNFSQTSALLTNYQKDIFDTVAFQQYFGDLSDIVDVLGQYGTLKETIQKPGSNILGLLEDLQEFPNETFSGKLFQEMHTFQETIPVFGSNLKNTIKLLASIFDLTSPDNIDDKEVLLDVFSDIAIQSGNVTKDESMLLYQHIADNYEEPFNAAFGEYLGNISSILWIKPEAETNDILLNMLERIDWNTITEEDSKLLYRQIMDNFEKPFNPAFGEYLRNISSLLWTKPEAESNDILLNMLERIDWNNITKENSKLLYQQIAGNFKEPFNAAFAEYLGNISSILWAKPEAENNGILLNMLEGIDWNTITKHDSELLYQQIAGNFEEPLRPALVDLLRNISPLLWGNSESETGEILLHMLDEIDWITNKTHEVNVVRKIFDKMRENDRSWNDAKQNASEILRMFSTLLVPSSIEIMEQEKSDLFDLFQGIAHVSDGVSRNVTLSLFESIHDDLFEYPSNFTQEEIQELFSILSIASKENIGDKLFLQWVNILAAGRNESHQRTMIQHLFHDLMTRVPLRYNQTMSSLLEDLFLLHEKRRKFPLLDFIQKLVTSNDSAIGSDQDNMKKFDDMMRHVPKGASLTGFTHYLENIQDLVDHGNKHNDFLDLLEEVGLVTEGISRNDTIHLYQDINSNFNELPFNFSRGQIVELFTILNTERRDYQSNKLFLRLVGELTALKNDSHETEKVRQLFHDMVSRISISYNRTMSSIITDFLLLHEHGRIVPVVEFIQKVLEFNESQIGNNTMEMFNTINRQIPNGISFQDFTRYFSDFQDIVDDRSKSSDVIQLFEDIAPVSEGASHNETIKLFEQIHRKVYELHTNFSRETMQQLFSLLTTTPRKNLDDKMLLRLVDKLITVRNDSQQRRVIHHLFHDMMARVHVSYNETISRIVEDIVRLHKKRKKFPMLDFIQAILAKNETHIGNEQDNREMFNAMNRHIPINISVKDFTQYLESIQDFVDYKRKTYNLLDVLKEIFPASESASRNDTIDLFKLITGAFHEPMLSREPVKELISFLRNTSQRQSHQRNLNSKAQDMLFLRLVDKLRIIKNASHHRTLLRHTFNDMISRVSITYNRTVSSILEDILLLHENERMSPVMDFLQEIVSSNESDIGNEQANMKMFGDMNRQVPTRFQLPNFTQFLKDLQYFGDLKSEPHALESDDSLLVSFLQNASYFRYLKPSKSKWVNYFRLIANTSASLTEDVLKTFKMLFKQPRKSTSFPTMDQDTELINILKNISQGQWMHRDESSWRHIYDSLQNTSTASAGNHLHELITQLFGEVRNDTNVDLSDGIFLDMFEGLWNRSLLTSSHAEHWMEVFRAIKEISLGELRNTLGSLLDIMSRLDAMLEQPQPYPTSDTHEELLDVFQNITELGMPLQKSGSINNFNEMMQHVKEKEDTLNPLVVKGNRRFLLQLDSLFNPEEFERKKREHVLLQFLLKIPRLLNASELDDGDLTALQQVNDLDYFDYSIYEERPPKGNTDKDTLIDGFLGAMEKLVGVDLKVWNDSFPQFVGQSPSTSPQGTSDLRSMYYSLAKGIRMMSKAFHGILSVLQKPTPAGAKPTNEPETNALDTFLNNIGNVSQFEVKPDLTLMQSFSKLASGVKNSTGAELGDVMGILSSLFGPQEPDEWRSQNTALINNWSDWTPWSTCSVSCDYGEQVRRRTCSISIEGLLIPSDQCKGAAEEVSQCHVECHEGSWAEWSSWSVCDNRCGIGNQNRSRLCDSNYLETMTTHPINHYCNGSSDQKKTCREYDFDECSLHEIFVPGTWSDWSAWTTCPGICKGSRDRQRSCHPLNETMLGVVTRMKRDEGLLCEGDAKQNASCTYSTECWNMTHPIITAKWTEWSSWSQCDNKCGVGNHTRSRICLLTNHRETMTTFHGNHSCYGRSEEKRACSEYDFDECALHEIFVPGTWTEWGQWSKCSENCTGHRNQHRLCHPLDEQTSMFTRMKRDEGLLCKGNSTQNTSCVLNDCEKSSNTSTIVVITEPSITTTAFPNQTSSPVNVASSKQGTSSPVIIALSMIGFVLFIVLIIWYFVTSRRRRRGKKPYRTEKGNSGTQSSSGGSWSSHWSSSPRSSLSWRSASKESALLSDRNSEESARLLDNEDPADPTGFCPYRDQTSTGGISAEWLWPWETEGDDWAGLDFEAQNASEVNLDVYTEVDESAVEPQTSDAPERVPSAADNPSEEGQGTKMTELEKSAEAWFD